MNVVFILFNLVRFVFVVNILFDFLLIVENVVRKFLPVVMMDIYIKIIVLYYVDNVKKNRYINIIDYDTCPKKLDNMRKIFFRNKINHKNRFTNFRMN